MKIAMIGSRGFNARYGGIETMLSELCPRLTKLGCSINVFSRSDVSTATGEPAGLRAIPVGSIGGKLKGWVRFSGPSLFLCQAELAGDAQTLEQRRADQHVRGRDVRR